MSKKTQAVAAVVAAGAGVVAVILGIAKAGQWSMTATQSGTGNTICVASDRSAMSCGGSDEADEARLVADATRHKDVAPQGAGPWEFVVVRDMRIGLKVRTTPTVNGVQVGGLQHHHLAWVVCQTHSGFDPEGNGDRWLKIKWDNQARSTSYFESETGATGTGWVHSYYVVPVNQNGDVPDC